MRSSAIEETGTLGPSEPWEIFTALAVLVVEGRTPGGEHGYHAGPHCHLPLHPHAKLHDCDLANTVCVRAEALFHQLRVMWGVGVGVTLEVLLGPECHHGAALAASLDTANAPSHHLRLIEQWHFDIFDRRLPDSTCTGMSLLSAVRSFLHFSQLSAWLSVSKGAKPCAVIYRLTVTSPVFCSKFVDKPEEHIFPLAYMGHGTSIRVQVLSFPRCNLVPFVLCLECTNSSEFSLLSDTGNRLRDEDLRRNVMKSRLYCDSSAATSVARVSRSESPDTQQLGESLLDPPSSSLSRFPRRFQSPSRGSPSAMETPEHLICRPRLGPDWWLGMPQPPWCYALQPHCSVPNSQVVSSCKTNIVTSTDSVPYCTPCMSTQTSQVGNYRKGKAVVSSDFLPHPPSHWVDTNDMPSQAISDKYYCQMLAEQENVFRVNKFSTNAHNDLQKTPDEALNMPRYWNSKFGSFDLPLQRKSTDASGVSHSTEDDGKCLQTRKCISHLTNVEREMEEKKSSYAKTNSTPHCGVPRQSFPFDLTRRETMEILSVLHHPSPIPPLRMPQCSYGEPNDNVSKFRKAGKSFPIQDNVSQDHRMLTESGCADCQGKGVTVDKLTNIGCLGTAATEAKKPSCQTSDTNGCDNTRSCLAYDELLWTQGSTKRHLLPESMMGKNYVSATCDERTLSKCVEGKQLREKCVTIYNAVDSEPTVQHGSPEKSIKLVKMATVKDIKISEFEAQAEIVEKLRAKRSLNFLGESHLRSIEVERQLLDEGKQKREILVVASLGSENLLKEIMKRKRPSFDLGESEPFRPPESDRQSPDKKLAVDETRSDLDEPESRPLTPADENELHSDLTFNEMQKCVPSASEKAQFRRSLDCATNLVFHNQTGLPLTSSPAPLRRGKRFDFDFSLSSVAAIKRSTSFQCGSLYSSTDADDDEEPDSNSTTFLPRCRTAPSHVFPSLSSSAPATVACSNLLGSFEECVLNGRLEPVSTVQGFRAEIAASGSFCPRHLSQPVTVFFYTLCDNDQISSPYMGHVSVGKKGYHVPAKGTMQVTLFNPHGTVVKMFVVTYDLSDMPPNSRTFLRQRTLNMPVGASDADPDAHQWLRYLIHLRFASSKSGKIYLHTDVRMLIFHKSDADAATLHGTSRPYELRSFTHGPTNPKFSPRK